MIRPTAAFCGAAIAAVALGVGVGFTACPAQDAGLSIEKPAPAQQTENMTQGELHTVHEYPALQGSLVSPFLPEHPTREQSRAKTARRPTPKPEASRRPLPEKELEIRLVGVVSSDAGRRAILAVGKRQILLSPGDEAEGVTLVSLTEREATVATPTEERVLSLSRGNWK